MPGATGILYAAGGRVSDIRRSLADGHAVPLNFMLCSNGRCRMFPIAGGVPHRQVGAEVCFF